MLPRWPLFVLLILLTAAVDAAQKRFFQVVHGGDSGPGSLRQAILDANASPTQNWILIPCELTVAPLSSLPEITRIVVIQGSCSSASGRPTIDGFAAGASDGLVARVPLRLFNVDLTRFAGSGISLRDHMESVILGSRIRACGRGVEIRGGGRHALALVEASDNAGEGILAVASNANALGHPGHCGIPEGCSDLDEDLRFDGWLDGEVTVSRNERGLVASGALNTISVIATDNRGDGVVLEGSSQSVYGRASGNWGVGVRATGFHPPGIVSSGNGGDDRALDDEFVAIDAVAKAWTDDTERQPA
ncbi:MAG TPA: right-handed parallel beta-helix repeat-containing protein, partial [Thermoanaerobaculia bacterium]|nr:right-handed parallel beta-helix repeat-containing protein [Thermoanaerobaculia bacterium]